MEAYQANKAEPAADRLLTLMPAAGHMVHMPATSSACGSLRRRRGSNELAIAADEDYISQCRAQACTPWLLSAQPALPLVRRDG